MPGPSRRASAGRRGSTRRWSVSKWSSPEERGPRRRAVPSRMKKTFQLKAEGKHPDRVLEAVKHEIRKYIKRERRRELPAGADFWDFDCKFGLTPESAAVAHPGNLTELI